jgi:Sulfotransferase domain
MEMAKLLAGARMLLGMHHPGRNLDVFPDDVFIVSFPKSGNTWTRFLVANLISPNEPADFSNINRLIPDPEAMSRNEMNRAKRPRFIKSHQYFDPRYPKVIYIVRDPRDVALSQYHFHRKRRLIEDGYPIERFVTRFIAGETSVYGSWGENAASWLSTRYGKPGFLLIRYEDMLEDAERELQKIASFLGKETTAQYLSQVVARSSADRMRELEKSQAHLWSSTRETRQDVAFVREARAGGWKSALPADSVSEMEGAWAPLFRWLGYELSTEEAPTKMAAHPPESLLGASAV